MTTSGEEGITALRPKCSAIERRLVTERVLAAHEPCAPCISPVPARASLPTPFTSRLFQVSGCLYLLAVVLLDPGSDVQGPGVGKEERASDEERVRIGSQRPGLRNKGLIITAQLL